LKIFRVLVAASVFAFSSVSLAQTNDFGVGGVLDVPSARSPDENAFSVTISRRDVADIYAISYQVLPRLETSFRYIISFPRDVRPVAGSFCDLEEAFCRNQLKDRSFEIKYRLLDESDFIPEVAVGIRDILGTGVFSAEYVVANKRIGNLDLSAGIGWGRLAERSITKNPLGYVSDQFYVRENEKGLGGEFNLKSYFRGPDIGAFGSVRYSLPQWRVDLLAAYNSDSYARERSLGTLDSADPLSVGVEWEATPGVRLTASWQQGNNLALKLSAALDTGAESPRKPPNGFGATDNLAAINNRDKTFGWFPRMAGGGRHPADHGSRRALRAAKRPYRRVDR
jgi:hypothetical protein